MIRPFDWRRDCPDDVARRRFPPIAGPGRGVELDGKVSLRDRLLWLQGRDREVSPAALRQMNGEARQ